MNNNKSKLALWAEILRESVKLGLTSFGGPVAHLGYFREAYVKRRKWLDEESYADLVALCQFLPGPASSQVGIGIGLLRGGWLGALLAWIGFTLPSAVALALFAYLAQGLELGSSGWIHGLKLAAVVIVVQAVWGMGRSLAPDRGRATLALTAAVVCLLWSTAWTQVLVIAVSGLIGWRLYRPQPKDEAATRNDLSGAALSKAAAVAALILFAALLVLLPLLRTASPAPLLAIFDSFYRSGALVFGGGHVVLPLLEQEVVPAWMSKEQFLAGYGATQAVPGPLFTFAAYLGMLMYGPLGAAAAIAAMFLPAFLLVIGALPFWSLLRKHPVARGALTGINAGVVGLLLAALYDPVWVSAVHSPADFCLCLVLFGMLIYWKLPPWLVVVAAAAGGTVLGYL